MVFDGLEALKGVAAAVPGLRLLAVFGSRARGDSRPGSDWDLAYLGDPGLDPDALLAAVAETLGADRIDLVDLARAGGQLRYRIAREGRLVDAVSGDDWDAFRIEAVTFWCDVEPVLRRAYDEKLEALQPPAHCRGEPR